MVDREGMVRDNVERSGTGDPRGTLPPSTSVQVGPALASDVDAGMPMLGNDPMLGKER